ncbi:transcriptional regulator [Paenibacillus kribbensis]|uniref:transcriptional regulator n=1 Tax=Paenibacillus kribbensis TaxID=172713 RepID=UPI00268287EF
MAVHINSLLAAAKNVHCTSEWFTDIVGTNPVNIRKILVQLKKAGLAGVRASIGDTFLLIGLDC